MLYDAFTQDEFNFKTTESTSNFKLTPYPLQIPVSKQLQITSPVNYWIKFV